MPASTTSVASGRTTTGVAPPTAVSVAWPRPSTTVWSRRTTRLRSTSYTPGVSRRFRPGRAPGAAPARESLGRAMWNDESGRSRPAAAPAAQVGAPRVAAGVGHADQPAAVGADVEERLLAAQRRAVERRVGRGREGRLRGGADRAGEDLVPHAVGPLADLAVAGQPLLLGAVDDRARARVGEVAAAGELRTGGAVVHQREVAAADVDAAQRGGLRGGPEVGGRAAAVLAGAVDVDREVGQRAPEVVERDAVGLGRAVGEAAVVDLDLAVDHGVGRARAEPGDLGVVADLDLQRLGRGAVGARQEEQAPPLRRHLGVDLLLPDRVRTRADLRDRHRRVEDDDPVTEVGCGRRSGGGARGDRRGGEARGGGEPCGDQGEGREGGTQWRTTAGAGSGHGGPSEGW